jgi:hypothetical protein
MAMSDRQVAAIFVSPSTIASPTNHTCPSQLGNPFDNDHGMFDHPPFHMVPSFDIDERDKPGTESSKNLFPFRSNTGRPQLEFVLPSSGRTLIDVGDSFVFNDADATEIGGNVEDCWNDPLLPLSGKASFEDMEPRKQRPLLHHRFGGGSGVTSAETLKSRLGQIHERIRSGILTHPAAEQGPLLSIVASWARSVAASPLAPTIQRNAGGYPIVSPSVKEEEHVSSVPTAV